MTARARSQRGGWARARRVVGAPRGASRCTQTCRSTQRTDRACRNPGTRARRSGPSSAALYPKNAGIKRSVDAAFSSSLRL